jgi:hypothetical protein
MSTAMTTPRRVKRPKQYLFYLPWSDLLMEEEILIAEVRE